MTTSLTNQFSRLAPWTLGSRIIVMMMGIFVTSILTRLLTKEQWNEYSILKNLYLYICTFGALGLDATALRFCSELFASKNYQGIKRLIKNLISIQTSAIFFILIISYFFQEKIKLIYNIDLKNAITILVIICGIAIIKETLRNSLLALFHTKALAIISFINALMIPTVIYLFIHKFNLGAMGALSAEGFCYAFNILLFLSILTQNPQEKQTEHVIYKKSITGSRIFRYAFPITTTHAISLMVGPQIMIFFIGYFFPSNNNPVGIYFLATEIPSLGMNFMMMALSPLITAMIVKKYYEEHEHLEKMIRSYFKLLIIFIIPLYIMGVMFLDKALEIIAGQRGVEAGWLGRVLLATSLTLIFIHPIGTALKVLERAHLMIKYQVIIGIINAGMIILILSHWTTIQGIICARYLISFLAVSWMTYHGAKIIGGFYFPYTFFFRCLLTSSSLLILLPFRDFWPYAENLSFVYTGTKIVGSLSLLFLVSGLAAIIWIMSARLFHLFQHEEIGYFKNANIPGMEKIMNLLVCKKYH